LNNEAGIKKCSENIAKRRNCTQEEAENLLKDVLDAIDEELICNKCVFFYGHWMIEIKEREEYIGYKTETGEPIKNISTPYRYVKFTIATEFIERLEGMNFWKITNASKISEKEIREIEENIKSKKRICTPSLPEKNCDINSKMKTPSENEDEYQNNLILRGNPESAKKHDEIPLVKIKPHKYSCKSCNKKKNKKRDG
jgi:nucleoid DNA-binding protein